MAQNEAKSAKEPINYGRFINDSGRISKHRYGNMKG